MAIATAKDARSWFVGDEAAIDAGSQKLEAGAPPYHPSLVAVGSKQLAVKRVSLDRPLIFSRTRITDTSTGFSFQLPASSFLTSIYTLKLASSLTYHGHRYGYAQVIP
jgi:hypothetical protein